jgi:hypothetical protein
VSSHVDGLVLRRIMGRDEWEPPEPFGPDGWMMRHRVDGTLIATCAEADDGVEWVHASIAFTDRDPTYLDLKRLHRAVFWRGEGFAYQVFLTGPEHVNIHEHALHLWGRLDGQPVLPRFGMDTAFGRSI